MIEIQVGSLARKLDVHRNTVSNWIRSGKLKASQTVGKRYRIQDADWVRFCRECGVSETVCQAVAERSGGLEPSGARGMAPNSHHTREVHMSDKPLGSVLVVGGGIAGIQATLDLANSGYYVYMVEKSAGIGGVMAQLDKTYPTNDCAM
jgi:excisionase family DNA binding protein